jgi:hypothetical protein
VNARAAVVAALAAAAALALLVWSPWQGPAPAAVAPAAAPTDAANAAAAPSPSPAQVGAPEPITAATTFAFRGRVTDQHGRGLAGARVQRIDGEAIVGETLCGGDGAFLLAGAPTGRWSLRVLADGFAPAQRGDLDASVADDGMLDVGALPLRPATTYRGRVQSAGTALAGARVVLRTELRADDTMVPLVRTLTTDDDGWFFVADAPPPPVHVEAAADGHRPQRLHVTNATDELRFDLEPVPIVRGRVVSATTGAPLPQAHVLLVELQPGMELPVAPLPDFAPLQRHRVRDDGTFARELGRSPFALAVTEVGHVAQLLGPFTHDPAARAHTIAMQPGAIVRCRATGAPANSRLVAELRREATTPPVALRTAIAPEPLLLPPVPPGRWLLRVVGPDSLHGEQWLELGTATASEVELRLQK